MPKTAIQDKKLKEEAAGRSNCGNSAAGDIDVALCRSVLYDAMSLALHYPTGATCARLLSEDARLALREAAAGLDRLPPRDSPTGDTPPDIVTRVEDWIATFPSQSLDSLLSWHGYLFGHTARGAVCPYETEYGQEGLFQQPRQLSQIAGFYQAFGLTPRLTERERADHASCELEFMDFLARKEAFALESGDASMLEETRKAARLFLKNHLGRFGRAFARSLQEHAPEGFFVKLGALLFDFILVDCLQRQVEAGPPLMQLRSAEDDQVPMACGSSDSSLVQLEIPN